MTDVIITLGAAVLKNGTPSPTLERRVNKSVRLYKEGKANFLLMSGGLGKHPPAEAIVMKELAVSQGIPSDRIFIESNSINTLQSSLSCASIMKNNGWSSAIIVTDSYHLFRSVSLFKAVGVSAQGSFPEEGRGKTKKLKWAYMHIRELLALPWNLLKVLYLKFVSANFKKK